MKNTTSAILLITLISINSLSAEEKQKAAKITQTDSVGAFKGKYKLGTGIMYHRALGSNNYNVTAELERFISDHNGLILGLNVGVASDIQEAQSYHGFSGFNFHAFPRSWYDLYAGGRGGFTNIFVNGERTINPTINVFLGTSVYIKKLFIDFEFGYAVYGRGVQGQPYSDHSAIRTTCKMGYLW